ncbi:hypothetical protein IMZ31_22060 (plasmid) [Pontibacillus sp. ALD_SL1]|uniref:hypothetical protein n=1 Tax=Pontibacillus sp. ALD_SL1 TaxID=2777185 RepID=UPI001A96EB87|nr:hypothetical protein [Pontibacillus sp. ALD_SL1]QST02139.1 hypothetical protein IMZ31_22060 [Pontibacillus sp. ALD_SL1]
MELKELRIQRKRIRIENANNPKRHVYVFLPLHPKELDDIIEFLSGHNEYGMNEEMIKSFYSMGNVEVDVREENKHVAGLAHRLPSYAYGKNPSVTKQNGEIFTGQNRRRGKSTKRLSKKRIRGSLQTFLTNKEELLDAYTNLTHLSWEIASEKEITFQFSHGLARELFFLPTLTEEKESGVLIRAEEPDFYLEKKEEDPTYEPMIEVLYGNMDDGYDKNLDEELYTAEEFLNLFKEERFHVPLSKRPKRTI